MIAGFWAKRRRSAFIRALKAHDRRAWQLAKNAKWPAYVTHQLDKEQEFIALLTQFRDTDEIKMTLDTLTQQLDSETSEKGLSRRAVLTGIAGMATMGASGAYAQTSQQSASTKGTISIQDYYASATPVDEFGLAGLRVLPKTLVGQGRDILSSYGTAVGFTRPGEFSEYFFSNKYGQTIAAIFRDGGSNPAQIGNFLKHQEGKERVSLYREGYMLIFSGNNNYIVPIGNAVADKIKAL